MNTDVDRPARAVSARRVPLVRLEDLGRGAALLALTPLAWSLPPRRWQRACRILGTGLAWFRDQRSGGWTEIVARTVGNRPIPVSPTVVRRRVTAQYIESTMQVLRSYRPGGDWDCVTVLDGREHLDEALGRGSGCVLWVHRFRPFVHFVALHKAGLEVWRPSNRDHGYFRHSRAGRRWLNPIQRGMEARYSQRVIADESSLAHLRVLRQRLRANALVSFYGDDIPGGRTVEVSFLDGWLRFGTQPASLAIDGASPLLPVFPLCEAPNVFRVVIGAPLTIDAASGGRRAAADAVRQFSAGLEPYVLRYPDQWHDWWRVRV